MRQNPDVRASLTCRVLLQSFVVLQLLIGNADNPLNAEEPTSLLGRALSLTALTGSSANACDDSCDSLNPCKTDYSAWAQIDLLGWWGQSMSTPILATSAPRGETAALGNASTEVLYGNGGVLSDLRLGGRLRAGFWLNDCGQRGIEGELLGLIDEDDQFFAHSAGFETLSRPFQNALNGEEFVEFVGYLPEVGEPLAGTGAVCGGLEIHSKSEFQSASILMLQCIGSGRCGVDRVETLLGYRYARLGDSIVIQEDLMSTDPLINPPLHFDIEDSFSTRNTFNGVDLGLQWSRSWKRCLIHLRTKVALGSTSQVVDIFGNTTITEVTTGDTNTYDGGLLTQTSNIGRYDRDRFSVIPEAELAIGYRVTDRVTAKVGYNFLDWSNVLRAGKQIDTQINPNYLPPTQGTVTGPPNPAFAFQESGIWFQGMSLGLAFNW